MIQGRVQIEPWVTPAFRNEEEEEGLHGAQEGSSQRGSSERRIRGNKEIQL